MLQFMGFALDVNRDMVDWWWLYLLYSDSDYSWAYLSIMLDSYEVSKSDVQKVYDSAFVGYICCKNVNG